MFSWREFPALNRHSAVISKALLEKVPAAVLQALQLTTHQIIQESTHSRTSGVLDWWA